MKKKSKRKIIARMRPVNKTTSKEEPRKSAEELEALVDSLADGLDDHSETTRAALVSFVLHAGRKLPVLQLNLIKQMIEIHGGIKNKAGVLLTSKTDCFYSLLERDFPAIYANVMRGGAKKANDAQDLIFQDDVTWFEEHPESIQLMRSKTPVEDFPTNCVIIAQLAPRRHAIVPTPVKEQGKAWDALKSGTRLDVSDIDLSEVLPGKEDLPGLL